MNLFRKKKPDNWIVKLFRITDQKSAEDFNMEECIINTIKFIEQESILKPTDFDINYQITRKSLNGFMKALKSQKEIVYSFVGFDSNNTNSLFVISNPMLNWTKKPDNSSIDVCIQIASNIIDSEKVDKIAKGLIESYDFDYGYITKLPWNYDSNSERKLKIGLFSITSDVNETDHAWTFHKLAVLDGFIKRLYPINYLNDSHVKSSKLKELLSNFGAIENVTKRIYKWTLDSNEIEILKKNEDIYEMSIITPGLEFLKTDKAKVINNKMKLKNASR
jgi:hypothetical protein